MLVEKMRNTPLKNKEVHQSYIAVEVLEPILFIVLSNPPTRNWTGRLPQAWMDNPRKAREKERSRGAFLRGLKRTTSHDGKGQYFGGNQGRRE